MGQNEQGDDWLMACEHAALVVFLLKKIEKGLRPLRRCVGESKPPFTPAKLTRKKIRSDPPDKRMMMFCGSSNSASFLFLSSGS